MAIFSAGCSFTPIREVESTRDDAPVTAEPAVLAFDDQDPEEQDADADAAATAVDEPVRSTSTSAFLEEREAAAWTVATSEATIGVYSAPDYLFTRLGVLGPGDSVLGTGRRVATDAVDWMEIRWGESTAWVTEAAFAPLG